MIGATERMVLGRKELTRVLWTYGDTHVHYLDLWMRNSTDKA